MQMKILGVVVVALIIAAGLAYGLLRAKNTPPADAVSSHPITASEPQAQSFVTAPAASHQVAPVQSAPIQQSVSSSAPAPASSVTRPSVPAPSVPPGQAQPALNEMSVQPVIATAPADPTQRKIAYFTQILSLSQDQAQLLANYLSAVEAYDGRTRPFLTLIASPLGDGQNGMINDRKQGIEERLASLQKIADELKAVNSQREAFIKSLNKEQAGKAQSFIQSKAL